MLGKWRDNETFRKKTIFVLGVAVIVILSQVYRASAADPGNAYFERTWERSDRPVTSGQVSRTWLWGPDAFTNPLGEEYADSPGGSRSVQYFGKSRMEISNPRGDSNSEWYVTNGLLVVELVTGRLQVGDNAFEQFDPATVNVAGDPDDPTGPTYATMGLVRDEAALADSASVIERLYRNGKSVTEPALAEYGVTAAERVTVPGIDHQVASPFWDFMNSDGLVYLDGQYTTDRLFSSPFYATGLPITESYWAEVKVGGEYKDVLVQAFERRVLTYTPGNPEGWQVEAGNVGQHYYTWRYEQIDADGPQEPAPSPDEPAETPEEPGDQPGEPEPTPTPSEPAPDPTPTPTEPEPEPTPDRPQPRGNPVTSYVFSRTISGPTNPRSVLDSPSGISITESGNLSFTEGGNNEGGNIAVVDSKEQFVQLFKPNGERLVGLFETDPNSAPSDVHIDKEGNFWVLLTNDAVLKGYAPNGIRFITIGGPGTGDGQFRLPFRFDVGPDGNFYISDSNNHRIQVMSKTGQFVRSWGSRGTGPGQFDFPSGIAVAADGTVYVADQNNHRVQIFTSDGTWLRELAGGAGVGPLNTPSGIDVDDDGNVYVADFGNKVVQKLNGQTGQFLNAYIGSPKDDNLLKGPVDVAVADGFVYVSDRDQKAVFKFADDARLVDRWNDDSRARFGNDERNLQSISTAPDGDVFVLDRFLKRIVEFDRGGGYLDEFFMNSDEVLGITVSLRGDVYFVNISGELGTFFADGSPTRHASGLPVDALGIAVDNQELIYIPDSNRGQIAVYDQGLNLVNTFGESGSGPGQFGEVFDIDVWDDYVFICDRNNNEIDVFNRAGNYLYSFGGYGSGKGQFNAQEGIDVDEDGFVYVADTGNNRVQIFTPGGDFITSLGSFGSGPGLLKKPLDVVGGNGLVYVADSGNIRVQLFTTN